MITRRGFLGGLVSAALFDRLYGAAEGDPLIRTAMGSGTPSKTRLD